MKLPPTLNFPLPHLQLIRVEQGTIILGEDKTKTRLHIASFYMAKFPVTQALYKAVMDDKNPSRFQGDQRPVETVSWNDAHDFINRLHKDEKVKDFLSENNLVDFKFRLPSEAEWEYTGKGGMYTQGYEYAGSDDLKQVGWYRENSGDETKPVGLLLPNELGFYDMTGNVWEWCEDDYHGDFENEGRPKDGSPWVDGTTVKNRASYRVLRGGSFFFNSILCRPSYRLNHQPDYRLNDIGFRLVLSLQFR